MFTIQSTINGKFIRSLFSDGHGDTFCADTMDKAYSWNHRIDAVKLAVSIGHCVVVPVKGDGNG